MTIRRGEIWIANFDPTQGSEQAGVRPTIIFQNDTISRYTTTVISSPLTNNLRRASLPSCVFIPGSEGGLAQDSVALCHQMRVLDKTRLRSKIGEINPELLIQLENIVLFTLGYLLKKSDRPRRFCIKECVLCRVGLRVIGFERNVRSTFIVQR